jgi:sugar phosphate isomerase/epimerase
VEPERALPIGRFSVPTLDWVRMPAAGSAGALPPVFGLTEILDGVAEAGFGAVGLDDVTIGDLAAADVAEALHARGLSCSDVGVLRAGDVQETESSARRLAGLAAATGAKTCIAIVADPAPRDPLASLEVAARTLDEAGVRLTLELASYGSLTALPEAIELCAAVGWTRCGLLLDSWHVFHGGITWPALEALDGSHVALVHLNDAPHVPGADPVHESRFRRLPPGEGTFDLERFLDVLSGIGYEGAISLEVLSSRLAATAPAVAALELMVAVAEAGFVQGEQRVTISGGLS